MTCACHMAGGAGVMGLLDDMSVPRGMAGGDPAMLDNMCVPHGGDGVGAGVMGLPDDMGMPRGLVSG